MASATLSSTISAIIELIPKIQAAATSSSAHSQQDDISFLKGLQQLDKQLRRIKAVLYDAEKREIEDESVKLWISELKEVAYDAEDVLDEFHYEVILRAHAKGQASDIVEHVNEVEQKPEVSSPGRLYDKLLRLFCRKGLKNNEVFYDVAECPVGSNLMSYSMKTAMIVRIKEINERLDDIAKSRENLQLREEDGRRRFDAAKVSRFPTSHLINEVSVYGREDDKKDVIELLLAEDNPKFSVIAIVGKGGLGKTTLAQLVYKDVRISQYFDTKMWIFVSLDFDIDQLTKKMVESMTGESCTMSGLSSLHMNLVEKVKGQKLLLVLDDVWSMDINNWECLQAPLCGAELVRVLVTTRNVEVANSLQATKLYPLGYLPEEESWKLFMYFLSRGRCRKELSKELVILGMKITEKCEGLPLTVKLLGSLLQFEDDEDQWKDVLQSNLWVLRTNAVDTKALQGLMLSYTHMPMHLKPCFLYCSLFPKSYNFTREELVDLWTVQGYVQPKPGRSIECIGNSFFDELVSRSFFDLFEEYSSSSGKKFFAKMHDNIHDLAEHLSNNEHVALYDKDLCSGDLMKVRHMSISGQNMLSNVGVKLESLRTLVWETIFTNQERLVSKSHINFNHLRVMKLIGIFRSPHESFFWFSAVLENLKQLRYLSIHSRRLQWLPPSIKLLYNLQILEISGSQVLEVLPGEIGELFNLQHLRLIGCECLERLPHSIAQLHNLETLVLEGCSKFENLPVEMGDLCNLQQLNIFGTKVTLSLDVLQRFSTVEFICNNLIPISGIDKLKELVKLRGHVFLYGLQNIVNLGDAKETSLKIHDQIEELNLHWSLFRDGTMHSGGPLHLRHSSSLVNNEEFCFLIQGYGVRRYPTITAEEVLENLLPHFNLKTLKIVDYPGLRNPSWIDLPSFTQLNSITFVASNVTYFPAFGQLPSLKVLILMKCPVKGIGHEFYSKAVRSDANCCKDKIAAAFPALVSLEFRGLDELERWFAGLDGDFPQLKRLKISECKVLTYLFGSHKLISIEEFFISHCPKLEPCSPYFVCPSKLKKVHMHGCKSELFLSDLHNHSHLEEINVTYFKLKFLVVGGVEWTSMLKIVHFSHCFKLTSLLGLGNLTRLEELKLYFCHELEHLSLAPDFAFPSMLKIVDISYCYKLTSLYGLHELSSLEKLRVENCPNLQLPELNRRIKIIR